MRPVVIVSTSATGVVRDECLTTAGRSVSVTGYSVPTIEELPGRLMVAGPDRPTSWKQCSVLADAGRAALDSHQPKKIELLWQPM